MNGLIIDSHALLWFLSGDAKLSEAARNAIEDTTLKRFVSLASLWEIGIKLSSNKLQASFGIEELVAQDLPNNGWEILTIEPRHIERVSLLSFPSNGHRDPFDRLLVAQALTENLSLVSYDIALDPYGIRRIWF